ncbi:serine/threonine protein kinase [Gigaspora margarita]|uniref:Serine/threonine protein kinase n=1 Tax=Gigaspora margarita TaxID=4874 RepID=A0A8H4AFI5_GIGMA|nr:serine/threonine protein kinase [Gigaspora margarita]
MSTTTKNNNSRYRNGCIGPGYKLLNIGNLFRKIGFKISKSGNSQETTDNSSLTNSDPTNSIINNNNVVTNLQTPHKVKIKSGHKDKYIPIDIPTFYNEQKEGNSSSSFQNRPKEIYQLERKVDALSNQLSQIEQMLSSLVQSPHQYLKINNSSIDNLKSNEVNDKKDCINESENITEKNSVSPTQNVNLQTSNNTTSNSKNTTNKNYNYIHYCHKCGKQKLHDEWCEKCDREIFESNFPNWTSGNEVIDNFIKETQLSATTKFNFLEWIPFSSLTNIKYIALREKLEPNKRTSAVIDNEYSSTFDSIDNSLAIPDLIYNEDSSTFDAIDNSLAIPDLIYNEDSSDFETPDSIDNADSTLEISDSLNDVADSLVKLG